jgi:hypothetical protein
LRRSESAQVFFESLRTAGDVTGLLGRAEDLYFEAKTCSDPFPDPDQRHLAEALSGFANADGGVLVYGLVAAGVDRTTSDVVKRGEPIKSLKLLNSRLLALVGQLVEPPVAYVRVELREFDRQPHEGFASSTYLLAILALIVPGKIESITEDTATVSIERNTSRSRTMFGRRRRPSLSLTWSLPASSRRYNFFNELRVNVVIGLHNKGRESARYPALRIHGGTPNHLFGLDGSGGVGLPKRAARQGHLFAGGSDHVIYPGTHLESYGTVTSGRSF